MEHSNQKRSQLTKECKSTMQISQITTKLNNRIIQWKQSLPNLIWWATLQSRLSWRLTGMVMKYSQYKKLKMGCVQMESSCLIMNGNY